MAAVSEERYVFETEWFDQQADLIRKYLFTFYPKDATIDMYDVKNKRMFLKRTVYEGVGREQLYLGAIITVYSRQLKVTDYGDVFTRQKFEDAK